MCFNALRQWKTFHEIGSPSAIKFPSQSTRFSRFSERMNLTDHRKGTKFFLESSFSYENRTLYP